MFWAHFDETVVNVVDTARGKQRPVEMLVGGCLASLEQWEKFNKKWKKALENYMVRAFHAKDFYAFQGEFKWFKTNGERNWIRHNKFRDRLADIILEFADGLIAFTSQVSVSAKGVRQAYEDAAVRAIHNFTSDRVERNDSLYIVLARYPELSPWSILKKFELIDWEKSSLVVGFFIQMLCYHCKLPISYYIRSISGGMAQRLLPFPA